MRFQRRHAVFLLSLTIQGACAGPSGLRPGDIGAEAERHRAALASLTVENGTTDRIHIAFRFAAGPPSEVTLGVVPPHATVTVAPLPAGEPVVLSAITADSARLVLPVRTFALNERWTWRIPADAAFSPAAGATGP